MADNSFSPELISDTQQNTLNIKDFILKYLKYLPWILLCGIIGLVIAYTKLRYTVPLYSARSSMLIQNNQLGGGSASSDSKLGALFMNPSGGMNLNNEMLILQSKPMLKRVVQNLNLQTQYYSVGNVKSSLLYRNNPIELVPLDTAYANTTFALDIQVVDRNSFTINNDPKKHAFGQPFAFGSFNYKLLKTGDLNQAGSEVPRFLITHNSLSSVADGFKGALGVAHAEGTDVLNLAATTENKDLCADILTNIMAVYDSMNIEDRNRIAQITLQFIDNRLDTIKKELSGVEKNLQDFMEKNSLYDVDAQASNYLERYDEYFKQQTESNVKLSIINWLANYLSNKSNYDKLVPTTLGIEEPALADYILSYNKLQLEREASLRSVPEGNPIIQKMDVSLDKMRRDMIEVLNNIRSSYSLTSKNLQTNTQNAQSELQSMPNKTRQLLEIKRKQQIMQDLFSFLLQKKIEVSISSASTISVSRVVEPAVASSTPVSPNKKSVYMMFLLVGLAIPVGIAAIIELFNDKVNSITDVENLTQTPIIGEIGHSDPEDLPLVMRNNSRKFIAEQFRIIRTNLQFILNNVNKPVIIVTSTFSGEGKSFVSTNLGGVMALAKKKTLVMEFDIRKPKVASGLGIHVRKGITNFIVGNIPLDELIIPVEEVPDLYLLPCGPVPPNPAELLLSPAIKELFEYARKNFDTIIVDTAPVGVVSDALILGELADGAVYIIRQGYTYKKQVAFIEDMYRQKKLPRQSIIINDIKHVRGYGGYYGYGYGYASGKKSHYFDEQKKSLLSGIFGKKKRKK
ncbi:polysaccharide biosynthesis tyrosine autokinase [Chitinophagaceae bacterium 26-R-25]|nr:polysaccharide biosynthesis tyrosine autokinase [Chitinophagaceae bacterium 26-R-25]